MNVTSKAQWLKRLPPWLYKLGAQAWIDYEYPRHLFIETTASCNLSCSYCPREKRNQHMDFALFQAVVDEASQYGARSFSMHLFGESLLYPQVEAACSYIKSKNKAHTILLTTNGTMLERKLAWLVSSGVDQVFWTWRTEAKFTPETKAKLRRWGKFRIRFIEEITPPEAYEEWKDWPNVEGRKLHNYGGNIKLDGFKDSSTLVRTVVESNSRWPCYHLWLAPAIAWNGNTLICCADPHQKEVLGHFPEMSVHEAWVGEKIKAIRDSHMRGEFSGICANCDVWKQYPDLFFSWQKKGVVP